jgi:hypothetical protein
VHQQKKSKSHLDQTNLSNNTSSNTNFYNKTKKSHNKNLSSCTFDKNFGKNSTNRANQMSTSSSSSFRASTAAAAKAQTKKAICGTSSNKNCSTAGGSEHHCVAIPNSHSNLTQPFSEIARCSSTHNNHHQHQHHHPNNLHSTHSNSISMPESPTLVKVKTWYTVAKQGVSC